MIKKYSKKAKVIFDVTDNLYMSKEAQKNKKRHGCFILKLINKRKVDLFTNCSITVPLVLL